MSVASSIHSVVTRFLKVVKSHTARIISNSEITNMSAKPTLVSIVSNVADKYRSFRAGFVVFSGSFL